MLPCHSFQLVEFVINEEAKGGVKLPDSWIPLFMVVQEGCSVHLHI